MTTPGNSEPSFSLGLEEEYLLVDLATRDLVSDPPAELLQRCIAETDGRVSPEFLRSQVLPDSMKQRRQYKVLE